ncbi:nucleocapsid phosphoprotein [Pteropus rufus nobecovirus]|nr:nucleocapsid phosphoprotein [Pteropus rufus nobecovirus]
MSGRGRGKGRGKSQPKVSFKNESDSESESEVGATGTSTPTRPKALPNQNVSWFAPIVQTGNKDLFFPPGQGVPLSDGVDRDFLHGYWVRRQRSITKGSKKILTNPRWYFYYTGTGMFGNLRYGSKNPDLLWVAAEGAHTRRTGDMGTRDPSKDKAIPLQFQEGGPGKGFYLDNGRSRQGSRSNSRSRSASRSRGPSGVQTPRDGPPQGEPPAWMAYLVEKLTKLETKVEGGKPKESVKVSAKNPAAENAKKLRQKRIPHKGSPVNACFGARGPGARQGNFGDKELCRLGTDDPRWPVIAQLAPSTAAFMFMSHLHVEETSEGDCWLNYEGGIKLSKDDPNFKQWKELLNSNVDAYKREPASPKQQQKKKKGKEEAEEVKVIILKDEGNQTDDEWLDDNEYVDNSDKPSAKPASHASSNPSSSPKPQRQRRGEE